MSPFHDRFHAHSDRPCLADDTRLLTFDEVRALGDALIAGLPRGRLLVMLLCSVTIESVAAYLALLERGDVPLLVEADLSGELLTSLASHYRVDVVLDPHKGATPTGRSGADLHPDLCQLLMTSGSTGSPKLVRQSRSAVASSADQIARSLDLDAQERPFLHLPMSYSFGLSVINSHISVGARVCLTRKTIFDKEYWSELASHAASSVSGVPFYYTSLRRMVRNLEVPSLRTLTQAGGRLDPAVVAFYAEWAARTGRRFVVMYGQTEAGPRIATLPPDLASRAPDSIGRPIPDVGIRLVDDLGEDSDSGEIVVSSPAVMMGYALTHEDLALGDVLQGSHATGDLARRDEDGLLRIVGRRARFLKIYGLRVNTDEVETLLQGLGYKAVCFGTDDALRVLVEEGDPVAVRERCIDLLSVPSRSVEVRRSQGPIALSASGKLTDAARKAAWESALSM